MMEMTRKHLLCLAVLTAFSPVLITQSHAQLHLEITKAPEEAPKIAIIPFANDQNIYPIVENDLNRSGKFQQCIEEPSCNSGIKRTQCRSLASSRIFRML